MKQRFSTRTRLVSALLTLAMVFTFLPFSAFAAGGTHAGSTIELSSYYFPDDAFREYLKKTVDKNGDRRLIPAERNAVKTIGVTGGYNGQKIKSLKGIEFFPNLQELYCAQNQLTELDVSENPELVVLSCSNNQLTELDVSKNEKLEQLFCNNNQLTSLWAENCTKLWATSCSGNEYSVQVYESTRVLDPSTLPGKFDISRVENLTGADKNADGTLTVKSGVGKVTYEYRFLRDNYATFTLNVEVVPDGTVTPPSGGDTPGGGSTPGGSTPGGGSTGGGDGGGAVVIVAAAGAVAAGVVGYGVYNYVSGQKLQALLPEGVAAPENRAQTALLLWNTAGRPEPAEAPAFADVADPDTAKAAQWCVEQGLMKRRLNGKFAPGSSIPAYQVLNAYRKLAG